MAPKEPQSIPHKGRQKGHQGWPNPIQIQKYLGGLEYPASKEEILEKAREEGADQAVMTFLSRSWTGNTKVL